MRRVHALLGKEMLEALYFEQKKSLAQIADQTGTNYRLVRDSFKAHGLTWRTKREARPLQPTMSPETRQKIAAARAGTKDSPETAAKKRAVLASVCAWTVGVPANDPRRVRQREATATAMRRPEVREACSRKKTEQIQSGTYYARGYHESPKAGRVYYMSGWELRRWRELDADPEVVGYRTQPCSIPYEWQGSTHRYIPDVLVQYRDGTTVLEEIKPASMLAQAHKGRDKLLVKVEAGQQFAEAQGWAWRVFSYQGR